MSTDAIVERLRQIVTGAELVFELSGNGTKIVTVEIDRGDVSAIKRAIEQLKRGPAK